jgi:hypothetical protein
MMPIAEVIAALQSIAEKHPEAQVRGEYVNLEVIASPSGWRYEVAVTDDATEKAREFAEEFCILSGGEL